MLHPSVEKLGCKRRAAAVAPAETLTSRGLQRALAIRPNDLNALGEFANLVGGWEGARAARSLEPRCRVRNSDGAQESLPKLHPIRIVLV